MCDDAVCVAELARICEEELANRGILRIGIAGSADASSSVEAHGTLWARLRPLVEHALARSEVDRRRATLSGTSDGLLLLVPADVPTTRLVDPLATGLVRDLAVGGRQWPLSGSLRLRVVVHVGDVVQDPGCDVGRGLESTAWLLDAGATAVAPSASPAMADLLISDEVYCEIAQCAGTSDATEWQPIPVDAPAMRTFAWVQLRRPPVVPGVGLRQSSSCPDLASREPGDADASRLVLWDIDHTLLNAQQVHVGVWQKVCSELLGRPVTDLGTTLGRTEPQVLLEALTLAGLSSTSARQLLPRALRLVAEDLAGRQDEMRACGWELPGARTALATLQELPTIAQSVLTGNAARNAALKLQAFQLDGYIDFAIGAYGSDDHYRPNLVAVARERARAVRGLNFDPATTVLIGDAPLDVEAGHRGGARVVAVATGNATIDHLRDAGADVVLANLSDTPSVLRAVLGQQPIDNPRAQRHRRLGGNGVPASG